MPFNLYVATNIINGKRYIGVTVKTVYNRWKAHVNSARAGSKIPFHRAIVKHGADKFVVELIAQSTSHDRLLSAEIQAIRDWNTLAPDGYNLTQGGEGALGLVLTPEQMRRLSESHMGFRHTDATKRKIAEASTGRRHSDDARRKMSEIMRKRFMERPETTKKSVAAITQYSKSEVGRKAISDRMKAEFKNNDAGARLRNANLGAKRSPEARKKMSDARSRFFAKGPHTKLSVSRFTLTEIGDIKALALSGKYNQRRIAEHFDIAGVRVTDMKVGRQWPDVLPSPLEDAERRYLKKTGHATLAPLMLKAANRN